MIKTWNFDFAGMMATYVGKNFAQGKKKTRRLQRIIPREIWLSVIKEKKFW